MEILTPNPKTPAKTVGDAFAALLQRTARRIAGGTRAAGTLAMQEQHVAYLLERLPAATPLTEVTDQRIAELLELEGAGRTGKPLSGSTLRKRANTLSQAIELATGRAPQLPEIPFSYRPRTAFLPHADAAQKLLDVLSPDRRVWFALALWTGQRRADVEAMRREDFDPVERWVVVRSQKTRRFTGVKIHAASELIRELGPHWAMLQPGEKLVRPWPAVNAGLLYWCDRLGMPRISSHTLRHTFFTWYVAANGFTPELLEIGGWKNLTIPAQVYAHALSVRFEDQIERTAAIATALRTRSSQLRRNDPAEKKRADGVTPPPARATHPEGLSAGMDLERRPPKSTDQPSKKAPVPRDRVELSTHGFSVPIGVAPTGPCDAHPSVVAPSVVHRAEGLCQTTSRRRPQVP
jgi:integrase